MFDQVDTSNNHTPLLAASIDVYKDDKAIHKDDMYFVTTTGRKHQKKITSGYHFKVIWQDGSTNWIPLSLFKESNPIEVADFVVTQGINDEPAFS